MWGVGAEEPHRNALAPGDLALVYLAVLPTDVVNAADGGLVSE